MPDYCCCRGVRNRSGSLTDIQLRDIATVQHCGRVRVRLTEKSSGSSGREGRGMGDPAGLVWEQNFL